MGFVSPYQITKSGAKSGAESLRQTNLKRTSRGYVRNLGRLPNGTQPKFYLGYERSAATHRLEQIATLWRHIEEWHVGRPGKPSWSDDTLQAAKLLGKGEPATLSPFDVSTGNEPPEKYYARINALRDAGLDIRPANESNFDLGRQDLSRDIENSHQALGRIIGGSATGQMLHEALEAYQKAILLEYKDSSDGLLTDNGKTKIDQIKTIKTYLPDQDLGLLDYTGCDQVFGIFRRRPISKRYGKPMSRKSCSNYIGELGRFFRWLHLSPAYRWRKPEDFDLISRTPRELDEDVEHESADTPVWTIEQLKILNEYALPIERIFLLLGLNCSYGADQAGRLRTSHLHLNEGKSSYIRRVRRKKKTRSMHLLWEQTTEGLRWALKRREQQGVDGDFVLMTDTGRPYWSKTKGGNRSQAIPNLWTRLLDRIQRDHPKFPRLPFNSLRDTSANFVRRIGGEETASLHLAHKHQSRDENLNRYTNPVRKKHFKVLKRLEQKLQPVFEAAGKAPWSEQRKNYIGRAKIKEILELRSQGIKIAEIARKLGVSPSTIYRHLPPGGNVEATDKDE